MPVIITGKNNIINSNESWMASSLQMNRELQEYCNHRVEAATVVTDQGEKSRSCQSWHRAWDESLCGSLCGWDPMDSREVCWGAEGKACAERMSAGGSQAWSRVEELCSHSHESLPGLQDCESWEMEPSKYSYQSSFCTLKKVPHSLQIISHLKP